MAGSRRVKSNKSYAELSTLQTREERINYLRTDSKVGGQTFGGHRYLNQMLYHSQEWKQLRNRAIIRDQACDLGLPGYTIPKGEKVVIHHINPITTQDILDNNPMVYDLNNVICVSERTHNAIHYGTNATLQTMSSERTKNDTCPWRH